MMQRSDGTYSLTNAVRHHSHLIRPLPYAMHSIQEELARAQRETEEHIQEMQRLAEQRERENQESREQHARTEVS